MSLLLRGSKRLLAMDLATATAAVTATSPLLTSGVASSGFGNVKSQRCCQRFISLSTVTSSSMSVPVAVPSTIAGKNGAPPPPSGTEGEPIKITDKCKQRLREILDEKGTFLRVSVEGGGCSGFQYKFDVDSQLGPDDIVIAKDHHDGNAEREDATTLVVIDEMSLDLIKGSTLDYETELIRSTFRIVSNPHAEQGCSCGASFNMKLL